MEFCKISTDLKTMNNNGDSEGVMKSIDISNQITALIQDVEEMIKIQQRMKENFRQKIWHSFDVLNSSQETVCKYSIHENTGCCYLKLSEKTFFNW